MKTKVAYELLSPVVLNRHKNALLEWNGRYYAVRLAEEV